MYINNNTFNRLLQNNVDKMSKVTNKLSTGKRINGASDDASGLQISTRMTAQIRGTTQVTKNIKDGISLLQTADGSLATVQDMLQRIRELAVQGQNGTYNSEQKKSIQSEMQTLVDGINKISKNTNFNGIPLLSGGKSLDLIGGVSVQQVKLTNIPTNTSPGAKTTVEFWMNWDGRNPVMPFGWNSGYDLFIYSGGLGFNTGDSNNLGTSNANLEDKWVHVAAVFINGLPDPNNVELYVNGEKQDLREWSAPTSSSRTVSDTAYIGSWGNYSQYFGGKIGELKIWDGTRTEDEIKTDMYQSQIGNEKNLLGYWPLDSNLKDLSSNGNDGQPMNGAAATGENGIKQNISIHTGSQFDSNDNISLFSVSDQTLNLENVDLSDTALLNKIDNAINGISLQRGEIGAKINRYEFKLENQQNLIKNTEDAKMRIEDQDMASAMSELTKEEILTSSIQRMMNISSSNYEQQMKMLLS